MERFDKLVVLVIQAVGWLLMMAAAGIVLLQCFVWLSDGRWPPFSVATSLILLRELDPKMAAWAASPQSWLGLHMILDLIPAWVPIAVIGGVMSHYE